MPEIENEIKVTTEGGITENEYITYKNQPVVRKGNDIYLGDMNIYEAIAHIDIVMPEMIILTMVNSKNPKETVGGSAYNRMFTNLKEAFEFAEAWVHSYNERTN